MLKINKLAHAVYSGDWHDAPLKWEVLFGSERQMFATRKDARLYARCRRMGGSFQEAIRLYLAA